MSVHSHDVKTQSSGTSVPVKPSLKSAPKSSRKRKRVEKDAEDSKSAEQPFSIKVNTFPPVILHFKIDALER